MGQAKFVNPEPQKAYVNELIVDVAGATIQGQYDRDAGEYITDSLTYIAVEGTKNEDGKFVVSKSYQVVVPASDLSDDAKAGLGALKALALKYHLTKYDLTEIPE